MVRRGDVDLFPRGKESNHVPVVYLFVSRPYERTGGTVDEYQIN